jgi:hypothetical protein
MDLRECLIGLDSGMWLQVHLPLSDMTGVSALLLSSNSLSPFNAGFVLSSVLANPNISELHTLDMSNNSAAFGNDIAQITFPDSNKVDAMRSSAAAASSDVGHAEALPTSASNAMAPDVGDAHAAAAAATSSAIISVPSAVSAPSVLRDQLPPQPVDGPLHHQREHTDQSVLLDDAPRFLVVRHALQKGEKCKNASVLAGILRRAPRLRTLVLDGCILRKADMSQLVAASTSHSDALASCLCSGNLFDPRARNFMRSSLFLSFLRPASSAPLADDRFCSLYVTFSSKSGI